MFCIFEKQCEKKGSPHVWEMLNAALSEGFGNMRGKTDFHISKWHLKEQKSRAVNVARCWDSGNVSCNSF